MTVTSNSVPLQCLQTPPNMQVMNEFMNSELHRRLMECGTSNKTHCQNAGQQISNKTKHNIMYVVSELSSFSRGYRSLSLVHASSGWSSVPLSVGLHTCISYDACGNSEQCETNCGSSLTGEPCCWLDYHFYSSSYVHSPILQPVLRDVLVTSDKRTIEWVVNCCCLQACH